MSMIKMSPLETHTEKDWNCTNIELVHLFTNSAGNNRRIEGPKSLLLNLIKQHKDGLLPGPNRIHI